MSCKYAVNILQISLITAIVRAIFTSCRAYPANRVGLTKNQSLNICSFVILLLNNRSKNLKLFSALFNIHTVTVYQRTPDIATVQSKEISHGAVQGQYFSNVFIEIRKNSL